MKKVLLRTISVLTIAVVLLSTLSINAKPTDFKPVFIGLNDAVLNGKATSDATFRKSSTINYVSVGTESTLKNSGLQNNAALQKNDFPFFSQNTSLSTCTKGIAVIKYDAGVTTGGIQDFQIPSGVSNVTIEAYGANGGDGLSVTPTSTENGYGGLGAYLKGTFSVTEGNHLYIIVGQRGGDQNFANGNGTFSGGGGGGSFITYGDNTFTQKPSLLLAAGGGGGGGYGDITSTDNKNANINEDGYYGAQNSTFLGGLSLIGHAGGTAGSGGGNGSNAGGGAGFLSNGTDDPGLDGVNGISPSNGATSAQGFDGYTDEYGGFGGGGATVGGGGGGGGYSGGGGGKQEGFGGGGGSYVAPSASLVTKTALANATNTYTNNSGDGVVIITWDIPQPVMTVTDNNNQAIANGSTLANASITNSTDFGTITGAAGSGVTQTFRVNNTGPLGSSFKVATVSSGNASVFSPAWVIGLENNDINSGGTFIFWIGFYNATPGTYSATITITSANNCLPPYTFVVKGVVGSACEKPSPPIATNGIGCGTGVVALSASAGPSETIDWYDAATGGTKLATGTNSFTTPSISNTTIYYAEARNISGGCVSATRTPVTATVTVVNFTTASTNVLCNGQTNGSITVTPTSGSAPYSYSKNGGVDYQLSNIFTGLGTGSYSIVVKDANNCTATAKTVAITQPSAAVSASLTATSTKCISSSDGSISVISSGGTPPYTYSKDGVTFQASNIFTNLSANTYSITVKDANGCTTNPQSIIVSEPAALGFYNTITNVNCYAGITGSILVTPQGGTAPFSYSKDGGITYQSGNTFSGLAAGSYNILVTDVNSCLPAVQVVIVSQPSAALGFTSSNVGTCTGQSNGSIIVTASNGTSPYQYSKDNGVTYQSGNSFTGLAAGNYNIVVKDAGGCTSSSTVTVAAFNLPTIAISPASASITSGGGVSLFANGGVTYSWSPSLGLSSTTGSSVVASPTGTTVYTVTATDAHGCVNTATSTITVTNPAITITGNTILIPNGDVTYTAADNTDMGSTTTGSPINKTFSINSVGTSPLIVSSIIGSGPDGAKFGINGAPTFPATIAVGSSNTFTVTFFSNTPGTYFLTVTVASNDPAKPNYVYNVKATAIAPLTPGTIGSPQTICSGTTPAALTSSSDASGGTGTISYQWQSSTDGVNFSNISGATSSTYAPGSLTATTYYRRAATTTANGTLYTNNVQITVNSLPSVTAGSNSPVCAGSPLTLSSTAGMSSYAWSGPGGFTSSAQNPTVSNSTTAAMAGTYTVTVTGANGCTNTASTVVTVNAKPNVVISPASVSIVSGNSTTLTASGATNYSWSPSTTLSAATGTSVTANPTTTTTYTVIGTDANTCSNTATATVTVTSPLVPATALNFDGVDDFVSINSSLGNVGTSDFTIEMNVRTSLLNTYFFSKRAVCGVDNFISMQAVSGHLSVELDGGSFANYATVTGTANISDNNWHHIAFTRKSGLVSIYVDGVLNGTVFAPASIFNNEITTLGKSVCDGQNGSAPFKGDMDEVRVWHRALCASELNAFKSCGLDAAGQTGLDALYHLDQGNINADNSAIYYVTDATGNYNGAVVNFALNGATSNWAAGTVSGTCAAFIVPTAPITGTTTVCVGSTTTLANAYTGKWNSSNSSVAIVNASGVVTSGAAGTTTITFTNDCGGVSTALVTVNAVPTVNAVANQEVCHNGTATSAITFTGSVPGTVYNWTNNTPSIGLAASGTGDIASFLGVNAGNAPVTATVTVTPTYTNNGVTCTGSATTFTITVDPIPTFNAIANQTVCAGASTTAVTFVSAVAGTTYQWSGGAAIGLANGSGATLPSFTAVNATGSPVTANILVISKYQGSSVACGTSRLFTITVNPLTTPTFTAVPAICSGASLSALPVTSNNGITGTWSPALNNTATTTYTFTPTAGQCATTATMTITVNAAPTVFTIGYTGNLCSTGPGYFITLSGSDPGGVVRYEVWRPGNGTGITVMGDGNPLNIGPMQVSGTFFIVATNTVTNCTSTMSGSITVNLTAPVTPTFTQVAAICSGASLAALPTTSNNGIIGTWSPALNNNATTTYTFTPSAGQCATTAVLTITVNPNPVVNAVTNQVACVNSATTVVNFTGTGTQYSWTNDNTSIGLAASGSGNIPSFIAVNATNAPIVSTVTVTPTSGGGSLIYGSSLGGKLYTFNSASNTLVNVISNGNQSEHVAVSPDGTKIYLANSTANTVSVYNLTNNALIATVPVGTSPSGIVVSPDGSYVYVSNQQNNTISVINASTNTVVNTIVIAAAFYPYTTPLSIAISPDGNTLYTANQGGGSFGSIGIINLNTNAVSKVSLGSGPGPMDIVVSPSGDKVYVSNPNSGNIYVMNTASNAISTINVGIGTAGVAISPDGNHLYASSYGGNKLLVSNTVTQLLESTIIIGTEPYGVTVTPDGQYVYVANASSNTVSVVSTASNTVTNTISTGINDNIKWMARYVSAASSSCAGTPITYTYTINPNNTVTLSSGVGSNSQSVCINTGISNITYNTTGATGASFSGLPSGVTGTWNGNVVTISGTPIVTGTFNYTVTLSGGCGTVTASGTITVSPKVTPTFTAVAAICTGTSLSALPTTSSNGITGTWSPALNNNATTTYTFTPNAGQCGTTTTMTITVNANPTVTITPSSVSIVNGNSTTLTAGGAVTYSWSPSTGLSATTGTSVTASPVTTTTYSVIGVDAKGCSNTASSVVTVTYVPATALNFDGLNDIITFAPNAAVNNLATGAFSMEAWVYLDPTNINGVNSIIRKSGDYNLFTYQDNIYAETWPGGIGNTTYKQYHGSTPIPANTWTHLAFVWDGTTALMYVNGIPETVTNSISSNIPTIDNLTLGTSITYAQTIKGSIDEVRIWKRALCQNEIVNNKNCELSLPQTDLQAYFKLNAGNLNTNNAGVVTAVDASGNSVTGTLNNFGLTGTTSNWVAGTVGGTCAVFSAAPTAITGNTSVCIGSITQLANSNTGVWSSSNNAVATISASGLVTGVSAGTVTITFTNTCGGVSTATVTVNALPTITGVFPTCAPTSRVLTGSGTPAASNPWTSSNTSIVTVDNTGREFAVAAAGGSAVITYTDANGCSATATIIVPPLPPTPTVSVVNNCDGTSTLTASGAPGYQWVFSGPVIATTASITVSTSGTYKVRSADGTCVGSFVSATATPKTTPVASITANGSTSVCPGSTVTLNANTGSGYTYQWYNNGSLINGAIASSYGATASGSYTVVITSNGCASAASNAVVVTVQDLVPPVIPTLNPIVAECNATAPIPNATDACTGNVAGVPSGPISFNTQGDHIIHWTFTDGNGNASSADQHVIIKDVTPPVPVCPANISVISNTTDGHGNPGANVIYPTAATATDNCGIPTISYSIPSGSFFPYGTTTVTVTADDGNGNTATCTFDVIVTCVAPAITSVALVDQVINTTAGRCDAPATYIFTASGIPAANLSYTFTGATTGSGTGTGSGSIFNKGGTNVTVNATNSCGTVTSSFTITVVDNEAPSITAPADITQNVDPNSCTTTVALGSPIYADNCPGVTVSRVPAGNVFTSGVNTVTWTATDAAGHTTSAVQTVTIIDNIAPVIVSCPGTITVNAEAGKCSAVVSFNLPPQAPVVDRDYNDIHIGTAGQDQWQSFTSGKSGLLTQIDLYRNGIQTNAGTISVYSGDGIGGTQIYSGSYSFPNGNNWTSYNLLVGSQPTLTAGQTYTIRIQNPGGLYNQGIFLLGGSANLNPGNYYSSSYGLNPVYQGVGWRMDFRTYVSTPSPSISATDNCGVQSFTSDHQSGDVFTVGTTHVTYTAVDFSGNKTTCGFDVVVKDAEPPVLVGVPADATVPCNAVPAAAVVTATDNCTGNPTVVLSEVIANQSNPGNYQIKRTWTTTDAAGNSTTKTQTITVVDNVAPVITCPTVASVIANTIEGGVGGAHVDFTATATDNCGLAPVVYSNAPNSFFPIGTTTVTVTSDDGNGNISHCSFDVTVTCVSPLFTLAPVNQTINTTAGRCDATASYTATASGIPAANLSYTFSGATTGSGSGTGSGSIFNKGVTTVTITATNICGTVTSTFTVTVEDHEFPVIVNLPDNISKSNDAGACGAIITWATVSATDNCSVQSLTSDHQSGETFATGTTTVHYTATDASGNVTTRSFTVTVTDNESPVLTAVPSDISVECDAVPVQATVTSNDNCSVASTLAYQFPSNGIRSLVTHKYNFENNFTDGKGTANGTAVGTVGFAPGIIGTAASFNGSGSYVNLGTAASISGTVNFAISAWVKTSSSAPQNIIQQRDGGFNGEYILNITSNHNGAVNVPGAVYFMIYNNGFQFEIFSNTRVDDGKWHHIVAEREGTTGRIFIDGVQRGSVIGPFVAALTPSIGTYVGKDVRDGSKSFNGLIDELKIIAGASCANTYDLERTWSANDASGNQTAAQQIVSVKDTKAPVITLPSNLVLSADQGQCSTTATYTATAVDNCSSNVSINYSIPSGSKFNVGTTTVTVTAKDACGNTASGDFTVTVTDNEKPTVTCPSDVSVVATTTIAGVNGAYATYGTAATGDNCGVQSTVYSQASGTFFPLGDNLVTVTVTDIHNNVQTCTFHVIVTCVSPLFTLSPVNQTINTTAGRCDAPANYTATASGIPTANLSYTFSGATTGSGTGTGSGSIFNKGVTTVTITATNICGSISTSFNVTVEDHEFPVIINLPANISQSNDAGNCGALVTWAAVTAKDNCPDVTLVTDHNSGEVYPVGTTTVHYTATDASGNITPGSFTVIVTDDEKPVITVPADITHTADAGKCSFTFASGNTIVQSPNGSNTPGSGPSATPSSSAVYLGTASGTDNCGNVLITGVRDDNATLDAPYKVGTTIITWTATDDHGHSVNNIQTITITDDEYPTIIAPADITVKADYGSCSTSIANVTLGNPAVGDNCAIGQIYNDAQDHFNIGTTTVTWTVTDIHGHATSATQKVTVIDDQLPTIICPRPITVSCASAVPAANPALVGATDNCSVSVSFEGDVVSNMIAPNKYTITRTYKATDASGNSVTCTQIITVNDNTAPVLVGTLPGGNVGECKTSIPAAPSGSSIAALYSDNCSGLITATLIKTTTTGSDVAGWTTKYDYTVSDVSGNTTPACVTYTVKDLTAPIVKCPAAINVTATNVVAGVSGAYVSYIATATDNCGSATVSYSIAPGTFFPVGTTTVNVVATDLAGNKSYCSFTVTVVCVNPVLTTTSTPTSNTYTGGVSTSLYLGYGAQSTTLKVATATLGSYSYSWSGTGASMLSSSTISNPVFTPTKAGSYPFTVVVTNTVTGCSSTGYISICVTDIRVPVFAKDDSDDKQTMCDHTSHDPSDCPHKGHNHTCDHKSHSKYDCAHRDTNDKDDSDEKDCDHQAHAAKDCPHVGHNHKACDHKAHAQKDCDHDSSNSGDDQKVCDHKAHDASNCSHDGHHHGACNHKAHSAGDCPHNGGHADDKEGDDDHKVFLCHVPPGNPGKTITLSIDVDAVAAHLANHPGDKLGSCDQAPCSGYTDNVKPVIECPGNVTVNYGASTLPAAIGAAEATDNSGAVDIIYNDVSTKGTNASLASYYNYTITRTWRATDPSSNYSECVQVITVQDVTKPVITCPGNITVSCSGSTTTATTGTATATDNSGGPVTITISSEVNGSGYISRTWKATDVSGNYATCTQTISIVDNVKPVITDPADITVNCGGSTLPAATGFATATDNCSTPVVTYSDATNGNVITRTWTAKDASGNTSSSVQLITVGASFTAVVSSVPTNSTYTGGVSTNLYLGFGAQSTTLQIGTLPTTGAPYTYAWSGSYLNLLNSSSTAAPVFTPTTFGYYTYSVTVTNKYGCKSTATISICVTDVRVPNCNGSKVYVSHTPSVKNAKAQTVEVLLSQVSSHIGSNTCGGTGNDRLGSIDQSPCNTTTNTSVTVNNSGTAKDGETIVATSDEDLKVTAMPNPSTTFFTLKIESRFQTPVELRVMDGRGRVVDAKSKIGANSTIQIGHNYSSGTYYAELIQGTQRKVVQLIKGRG